MKKGMVKIGMFVAVKEDATASRREKDTESRSRLFALE